MDNTKLKNRMSGKVQELQQTAPETVSAPMSSGYLALSNNALDIIRSNLKSQPLTLDLFDVVKSPSGGANYGFILGKNRASEYVTWQFHLLDDESVSVYWGHYIADREEALRDYNARGVEAPQKFYATVTETFQLTIEIEADSREKAEQIVSADWRKKTFTLGPECFTGVEFTAVPVTGEYS